MNIRPKTVRRLLYLAAAFALVVAIGFGIRKYNESKRLARIKADRDAGVAAFHAGDYPAALDKLKNAVRPNTSDHEALLAFATSRAKVELPGGRHIPEAIKLFELLRSVRVRENVVSGGRTWSNVSPEIANPLLDLYTRAGYSSEAVKLADAVLAVRPDDVAALRAKSIALFGVARYDEALAASQRLNEAAPFDLNGQLQTFWLLRRAKTPPEKIVQRFEGLLAKHPDDPRFEMLLGQAKGEAGDREGALKLLRSAAQRPAPDAEFVAQLSRVFDQQRLFEDSRALLARAAEQSDDPAILRVMVMRLWQDGEHTAVLQRLQSFDSRSAAADSTLLAVRALSLLALDRRDEATAIVAQLKLRGSDGAAQGWSAAIETRVAAGEITPTQLISRYLSAMARGGENGIVRLWIGDAHLQLGETEQAIREWRQAAELMPSWATPHVKIARAMLSVNRSMDAADAAMTAFRCAPDQVAPVTTLALARYALLQQTPSEEEQESLAKLVAEIQRRKPGEPETLSLHAAMLCRAGKHAEAAGAIKNALPAAGMWEPDVLAHVLAVSREFSLNLEDSLIEATSGAADRSPRMALRHAMEQSVAGRADEALEQLQRRSFRAPADQKLAWQVVLAEYREATSDADAATAWVALGDAHPDDFAVQSLILRDAKSAQSDREFFARTIDRVRKLVGDDGSMWRYARARFLLTGQPTQRESAEAVTLLTDLVRSSPNVPEYRVRLASAMENLGNMREAAEQLRAAADIDPRSVGVQLELARLLIELGKHPDARAHLARAAASPMIQLQQRLPLAQMLTEEGQLAEAAAVLEAAPSRDLRGDLLLADLHRRLGNLDSAAAIFDRRLQTDHSPELLSSAAYFFASRGQVDRARQIMTALDEETMPTAQRHALWATFEERYGNRDAARQRYIKAAEEAPTDAGAWRRLAAFHARQGAYADAVAAADRGLSINANNPELQSLKLQAQAMERVAAGSNDLAPLIDALSKDPSRAAEAQALRAMQEMLATTRPATTQIAKLRQSADRFPRYLPLQSLLARAYLQAGLDDDAANLAQRALDAMPGDPSAAALATSIFRATSQWTSMKSAAQHWKRLTSGDTRPADIAIAEACAKLNEPAEALEILQPYIVEAARKPDANATLLQIAASAMMVSGQVERTEDLLGPMLATSRTTRMIWMRVTAESAADPILAGEWLNRVQVSIDPAAFDEVAQFARAASVAASRFGDPAPARAGLELLRPFVTEENPNVDALFLAGSLQLQLGRVKDAENAYRKALGFNPDKPEARNDLAYLLLLRRGDLKEARQLVERAIEQSPGVATYHDTLARIDAELGNREAALTSYDVALQLDPGSLDALIGKAHLLRQMGQTRESRRLMAQIEPLLPTAGPLSEPVRVQLESLRQQSRGE